MQQWHFEAEASHDPIARRALHALADVFEERVFAKQVESETVLEIEADDGTAQAGLGQRPDLERDLGSSEKLVQFSAVRVEEGRAANLCPAVAEGTACCHEGRYQHRNAFVA